MEKQLRAALPRGDGGAAVEFGGDQTSPVCLGLAVAQSGFQVQREEGMKDVPGQKRHQQERLDGPGLSSTKNRRNASLRAIRL